MKYFLILILLLLLSFVYLFFKEKSSVSAQFPELNFFDSGKEDNYRTSSDYLTGGVIILDIRELTKNAISDSSQTPFLNKISKISKYFPATVNLSGDRLMNLESFLKTSPPHRINDRKEPFLRYKNIISDSLRNSSMPEEFSRSGYETILMTTDSIVQLSVGKYFHKSVVFRSETEVIEKIYEMLSEFKGENFLIYADLGYGAETKHFQITDHLLSEMILRAEEKLKATPLYLFISTEKVEPFGKTASLFYQKNTGGEKEESGVSNTDISKSLLNTQRIRHPNYFGGYDLENEDAAGLRDHFAGATGDTIIFFNEEFAYKRIKYSPSYSYYCLVSGKDATGLHTGINEKHEKELVRYFGGDYIKYIIIHNISDSEREFGMNMSSRRRFSLLEEIGNYYFSQRRQNRYRISIQKTLNAGEADTVKIYYASLFQNFQYTFKEAYDIAYGSAGIYAGKLSSFDENSYYGMVSSESDKDVISDNYDIRIYNFRVNY